MKTTIIVTTLVLLLEIAVAFELGAPTEACDTMTPIHGVDPQETPSPYLVSISHATFSPGERVFVQISAFIEEDYYEGFMVQVRDVDNTAMGTFEANEDYQVIDCPDGSVDTQNTATHNRHEHFTKTELVWIAPSTPTNVTFTFTIVRGYTTFWNDIKISGTMTEA